tara:strand:- start:21035 stop:21874 length:840 start_codon:yes stop_codon:yes gene_type:complete
MHKVKSYSEPILLPAGKSFHVIAADYQEGESHQCFHHFHEVSELILFHQVEGQLVCANNHYDLSAQSLVYVPSMMVHHFELTLKKKSWKIIQFSPLLFGLLGLTENELVLTQPSIIQLNDEQFRRFQTILSWLQENNSNDTKLNDDLLKVLIRQLALKTSESYAITPITLKPNQNDKMRPFIELIRQQHTLLNLEQAAALCKLSPAYFSRYFKKVFHKNFSQYMLTYRLHLASHYLRNSNKSVTTICYELNFAHPSYFIAKFKKYYGITPRQFRLKSID